MKNSIKIFFLLAGLYSQIGLSAQSGNDAAPNMFNGIGSLQLTSNEINLVNAAMTNSQGLKISVGKRLEGSVFINPEWQSGFIRVKSGAVIEGIPIRYNAMSHELYLLDGQQEYFLKDHFREFGYTEIENGQTVHRLFRNGFPPVEKNTDKTIYQVLAGSEMQLLKKVTKQLQENRSLDGQTYYRIAEEVSYYVYNTADKAMIPVRKGIQQLQADFPNIKEQISMICNNDKQKCKTENGLIRLFSSLIFATHGTDDKVKKPF